MMLLKMVFFMVIGQRRSVVLFTLAFGYVICVFPRGCHATYTFAYDATFKNAQGGQTSCNTCLNVSSSSAIVNVTSLYKMGSKQHDSTSSSEAEERSLFTRVQEKVEKAKRGLFEQTEAATHSLTRPSTSAQRPVTDDVSLSLSSFHDDSDQDKTVDPRQFSEDSSDGRSKRAEQCDLHKKK